MKSIDLLDEIITFGGNDSQYKSSALLSTYRRCKARYSHSNFLELLIMASNYRKGYLDLYFPEISEYIVMNIPRYSMKIIYNLTRKPEAYYAKHMIIEAMCEVRTWSEIAMESVKESKGE